MTILGKLLSLVECELGRPLAELRCSAHTIRVYAIMLADAEVQHELAVAVGSRASGVCYAWREQQIGRPAAWHMTTLWNDLSAEMRALQAGRKPRHL